jgi:hypothetical protein
VVLAALVTSLVSGCATDDGSAARAAADAYAVRATKQVCASLGACCGAASFAFDPVECEAQIGPNFKARFEEEAPAGAVFDAAASERCLTGLADLGQSCTAPNGLLPDDCRRVFVGTVPPGGECDRQTPCAPSPGASVFCRINEGHSSGVCEAHALNVAPHAKVGDACDATCVFTGVDLLTADALGCPGTNACYVGDGLTCRAPKRPHDSLASRQCVPLSVAGEPCPFSDDDCVVGTFCDRSQQPAQCKPAFNLGEACGNNRECESRFCTAIYGPPHLVQNVEGVCVAPPLSAPQECLNHLPTAQ